MDLLREFGFQCPLTGIERPELLRASHMNALFDNCLVSFDDTGRILVSRQLSENEINKFGLTVDLRIDDLSAKRRKYLQYRQKKLFLDVPTTNAA